VVISDIRSDVVNTQIIVSDVHQGVVDTRNIVSDIHRTVVKNQEGIDGKNQLVGIICTLSATKETLTIA